MKLEQPSLNPEQDLNSILMDFVDAVQAGRNPDRAQLLASHPELAGDLAEFLSSYDQLEQFAAPLRETIKRGSGRQTMNAPMAIPVAMTPTASGQWQLGDFVLLRELGRGGMGVVYEAEQISLRRRVALKMLSFAAALDPRQLQRFRNEAQAAAQLHHPHIVPVHAVGVERAVHYYAMQYIEGQSLATLIAAWRDEGSESASTMLPATAIPPHIPKAQSSAPAVSTAVALVTERSLVGRGFFERIARLGKQAAEGLEHAHQMGVVHRDVKPGNLLLDMQGDLWIADFGLAQVRSSVELTQTGELLGTLRYASPEQILAQRGVIDHRSDIYSLGATLYELLTLKPVFEGRGRHELLHQIAHNEPTPPRSLVPTVPVELETIVLKAMAKNPGERYQTAQDLADDLGRFSDDQPIRARRPTLAQRIARWCRRHRGLAASGLVLLVVAVFLLAVSNLWIAGQRAELRAAYDREQLKAREARQERNRAQESLRKARRAVDFFTQISEEELARMPPMQGVRRYMLETAAAYYQDFIEQSGNDPTLQAELEESQARVKRLLAELKAMQGYDRLLLLNESAVLEDMRVTEEQRKRLVQMAHKEDEQWSASFQEMSRLPADERQKRFLEIAKTREREVGQILTLPQTRRLERIAFQLRQRGPYGFRDTEVVQALRLTKEQQQAIRKLKDEGGRPMFGPMPGDPPGPPPEEQGKATFEKILALLTDEQRATWRQLAGEPFTGMVRFFPGGGPPHGGPRGPRPPGMPPGPPPFDGPGDTS